MAWIGAIVSAVVADASSGSGGGMSPTQAQQMVDPFAQYRAQYGQQLNTLMANPGSVTTLPGYQAQEAAGTNVLQRQLAATGQNQSGAEQVALSQYGQQFERQAFQDQYSRLSQLSGASTPPTQGGMAGVQQAQSNQTNASQFGGAIGSAVAPQIGNWFSNWSGGGASATGAASSTGF
jgi:hypothetical protein